MAGDEINLKHEAGILEVLKTKPIFTFQDIFVFYAACTRATAYNHNLDKLDSIKDALYANKRKGVTTLLSKWLNSDNATLQIAAMRLVCDTEEHQKLNQSYIDHTTKGRSINQTAIDYSKFSDEELRTIAELQRKGSIEPSRD